MAEHFENEDYRDLKREVAALRKRIEDLESGRARPPVGRARWWRNLSGRPLLTLPLLIVAVLLALGVLSAENSKQDALFIGTDGKVGIGTTDPKAALDVAGTLKVAGAASTSVGINTSPISNQNLTITPTSGNIPLNVTDPTNTINWLTVQSDGKVVMNGASVAMGGNLSLGNSALYFTKTDHDHAGDIGNKKGNAAIENASNDNALMILGRSIYKDNAFQYRSVKLYDRVSIGGYKKEPQAPLDVKGEIRGKLWTSTEYEWKQNPWEGRDNGSWTKMTKADRSACFLTFVSGSFQGQGEAVEIKQSGDYWMLGGVSQQKHLRAKAKCIGAPDDSW